MITVITRTCRKTGTLDEIAEWLFRTAPSEAVLVAPDGRAQIVEVPRLGGVDEWRDALVIAIATR